MLKRFAVWVSTESSVIMWGLQALVTAWVAFGFRASPAQTAAVTTIGAALVTIVTAFAARPVSVPVITGAVATVATAAAAFGLHLSSAQIGAAVPAMALVLALVLRQAITPLVTLRQQQASAVPQVTARVTSEDVEAIATRVAQKVRPARRTM
jgi:hypothetical protein